MSFLTSLLARRRLIIATALLLAVAGIGSWATMPREEDPQFPARDAIVIVTFPGADAEAVERLVVEPLEEHLAEVEEIYELVSTARAGVAVLEIGLQDHIYATDDAWLEVEDALDAARADFPAGVSEPSLDDDVVSQEAVVLAVTGADAPLRLATAAERTKRRLLALDSVRKVKLIGDPGEQITIEYDDATARRLGIDPRQLGAQLGQRSTILPGGLIHLGDKTAILRPQTEFASVEEIAATQIMLPSGAAVPLNAVARVRRGPQEPAVERMRVDGVPAVGLGVIPKYDLDRIAFGRQVREAVAELNEELAPLHIQEVVFQPDQVEQRLSELTRSLLFSIVIVAVVLFVAMGSRLGLLVVLVVPLVAASSIAAFATGGGILHQISMAALVLALGMLVDNAIVVAESIQYRLDQGQPARQAALATVRELALPLGTATGTTLAAFVPMLVSRGPTADFTRSIPIVIMLTLTLSYLFAVLVTPVLAELLLKPQRKAEQGVMERWAEPLARLAVRRSGWVFGGTMLLLFSTLVAATAVDRQFFPSGDRPLVIVDLELPEGTHLEATSAVTQRLETALADHPQILSVTSFIGRGVPRFYYNLLSRPRSPHLAQVVVTTSGLEAVEEVMHFARDLARRSLPEAEVVARRLEQGPPIDAPIEVRIVGESLSDLETATDGVMAALRGVSGTRDVRQNLGLGVPTVRFDIDDAAAGRHGLTRTDVGLALLGRTLGAEIGQYRVDEDPVPILVRSAAGERLPVGQLATVDVATPGGQPVPLEQVARLGVQWRPAAIYHRNGQREVRVQSQLAPGVAFNDVLTGLEPRLADLSLPPGVKLEMAGEAAESGRANSALLRAMPLGLLLLLFFLLLEFNSFRRVGIILMTVPLAATGVVPGLLLSGQPFGFMSVLGVIALVGIVVNNAIVLLDLIESRRQEGATIDEALVDAVRRRTRPILLTMGTTVAGLSPLAFSNTTLWPPLAWSMISGLTASTLLTLVVVPALYKLLFSPRPWTRRRQLPASAAAGLFLLLLPGRAGADTPSFTLAEAMARAAERPRAEAAQARAQALRSEAVAAHRVAVLPILGVVASIERRDRTFDLDTPLGAFRIGERESQSAGVELVQPLLDPAALLYRAPAARSAAQAEAWRAARVQQALAAEAAERFVAVLAIDARLEATEPFIDSLEGRLRELEARVEAGRSLEADALKIRLDLEAAELDRSSLGKARRVATHALGLATGLDTAAEPRHDGRYDRQGTPRVSELMAAATTTRPDLAALHAGVRALELRADGIRAERWPRLEGRASYSRSSGDPFRPDELTQGSLNLVWRPFAAATRAPQAAALDAERAALEAEAEALRRAIGLDIQDSLAQLETARDAIRVRERGVELATETLRVERERSNAGRATINDLLEAEAALRRQRTDRSLARLEVLRAWIRLDFAVGKIAAEENAMRDADRVAPPALGGAR